MIVDDRILTLRGARRRSCSLVRATGDGLMTPWMVQNCSSTQIRAAAQPICGGGGGASGYCGWGRKLLGEASLPTFVKNKCIS